MKNCAVFLTILLLVSISAANTVSNAYAPGRILVYFSSDTDLSKLNSMGNALTGIPEIDNLSEYFAVEKIEKLFNYTKMLDIPGYIDLSRWYVIHFPADTKVEGVVEAFRGCGSVQFAEPDYKNEYQYVPNDPMYNSCWALGKVQADSAWDISKGSHLVTISIVDSGIDTGHVDLKNDSWINFGEDVNGDSIIDLWDYNFNDDDNNGFIDDFWGWDFIEYDNYPMPSPGESHGTLCASAAAASTDNGIGVSATGFNTRLMNLRCSLFNTNLALGINYSVDNNADIISASWGSPASSTIIEQAVQNAHIAGTMFVTSAGNDDNYTPPWTAYPSLYPHVLSVGSTNENDQLSSFSNYCTSPFDGIIDLLAPGENILSATLGGGYETWQGTSASAPTLAGVCALVLSMDPAMTPAEVETLLVQTCDDVYAQNPGFAYGIIGHGRVNAFKALLEMSAYLGIESFTIDDNGNNDGRADPGETIDLVMTVYNDSRAQDAFNVQVVITCGDEAVNLINNAVDFGNIESGTNYSNSSNPFQFSVNPAEPHFTDFTVTFYFGDSQVQYSSFELELGRPEILLVDDDGGEFFEEFYQMSLDSLSIFTDVWDVSEADIDAEELQRYAIVIWETGNETSTLNGTEQSAVSDFLDAGGNLFISSKNVGADIGTSAFYADYLHASFEYDTVGSTFKAGGVDGCPFTSSADSLFFIGGTGAGNYQSMDGISPLTGAYEAFRYADGQSTTAGIYYQSAYNLVYLAFPFETISGMAGTVQRHLILDAILNWFGYSEVGENAQSAAPTKFAFKPNYPNPFNPETTISFDMPKSGHVSLIIYDVLGNEVARLIDSFKNAGSYEVLFDGSESASGVYFARLSSGMNIETQKMLLLK